MENRRIFEYLIAAALIGIGVPVFALLGAREGERVAAIAYPPGPGGAAEEAPGPRDFKDAVTASADGIERGRRLYAVNCVACHGAAGDGKGPGAAGLVPAPRDFLDPRARWTRGRGPLDLYATLTEGNSGTAMPGFSASLSVEDRWALVHYVGSLPGVKDGHQPLDEAAAAAWRP